MPAAGKVTFKEENKKYLIYGIELDPSLFNKLIETKIEAHKNYNYDHSRCILNIYRLVELINAWTI